MKVKGKVKRPWWFWFKMRGMDILFLVLVLFLIWAYKNDTAECMEVATHPCEYCGAYVDQQQQLWNDNGYGEERINWEIQADANGIGEGGTTR